MKLKFDWSTSQVSPEDAGLGADRLSIKHVSVFGRRHRAAGIVHLMISAPFHVGLVTPDLEATMATLTETTGARWTTPSNGPVRTIWTVDGVVCVTFRGAFTVFPEGAVPGVMRLELISGDVAGSLWEPTTGAAQLHHIGHWSDDLAADSARLRAAGHPLIATEGEDPENPKAFAYHRHGAGGHLELLDVSNRPGLEAWWGDVR